MAVPFDSSSKKWQVSIDGGVQARWAANGRELFFLGLDGSVQSARQTASGQWSRPQTLFQTALKPDTILEQYAVSADGRRVLIAIPIVSELAPLTVVTNWQPR